MTRLRRARVWHHLFRVEQPRRRPRVVQRRARVRLPRPLEEENEPVDLVFSPRVRPFSRTGRRPRALLACLFEKSGGVRERPFPRSVFFLLQNSAELGARDGRERGEVVVV